MEELINDFADWNYRKSMLEKVKNDVRFDVDEREYCIGLVSDASLFATALKVYTSGNSIPPCLVEEVESLKVKLRTCIQHLVMRGIDY